jgi:hypothetical protein
MNNANAEENRSRAPSSPPITKQVEEVDQRIREFGDQHPLLALGMVVAAGYIVGRIVSRL